MKKSISIFVNTILIFGIFFFLAFFNFEDFSEYAVVSSAIFFGILILNFYCLNWKEKLISDFIIEKKLNFLFIVFAVFYSVAFCVSFFRTYGLDRIMFCTIWSAIVNVCICNFIYLKK